MLIPEIKLSLGLSATQVGTLGTTQQFTGWMATMSAGYLGDRFTQKTGLMLGFSLAMTGVGAVDHEHRAGLRRPAAGMLFMGFGPSMFHPPAVGALSRRFADRRSFAISLHGTGGSVGEVLGPLVGAGLLGILYWRDALRVEFIPAIVGAVLLWRLLDTTGAASTKAHASAYAATSGSFVGLLRHRTLLLLFLVTGLRAVGQAVTAIFLPIYLREDLGYSSLLVGGYIAMGQIAGIGSQPLMGLLADRFGHKTVILPALLSFAVILALIPLADGKLQLAIVDPGAGYLRLLDAVDPDLSRGRAGRRPHAFDRDVAGLRGGLHRLAVADDRRHPRGRLRSQGSRSSSAPRL